MLDLLLFMTLIAQGIHRIYNPLPPEPEPNKDLFINTIKGIGLITAGTLLMLLVTYIIAVIID